MKLPFNNQQEKPLERDTFQRESTIALKTSDLPVSTVSFPEDKTIVDILEEKAKICPEDIAAVYEDKHINFQELNERANQLANFLIKKGTSTETLVPFCMEKSIDMFVALFGILKSGAAYVPIDPKHPQERIQYIVNDTAAGLLFVSKGLPKKLSLSGKVEVWDFSSLPLDSLSKSNPLRKSGPENLVYTIYTSGSTGFPKGVMVHHRGLMDHCYGLIAAARLQECRSYLITSPMAFDVSHSSTHIGIIQGAAVHLLSDDTLLDSEKLSNYLTEEKIDCLKIVPSLWLSHTESGLIPLPSKKLLFAGEIFPVSIHSLLRKSHFAGDVFNHYGPTEASISKTIHQVDLTRHYEQIPIGRAFSNSFVLILNQDFERVKPGEIGEIFIGGEGVARGYLNLPKATANSFIPDFYSGRKGGFLYRTGDLAKSTEDGTIFYLGRIDDQVKINGNRIEPGEIEKCIYQSGKIKQIAVMAKKNHQQKTFLVAYFVPKDEFDREQQKIQLKGKLPPYMIPQYWVELRKMPLNSNGKIDRKALPDPDWRVSSTNIRQPPTNETEKQLHSIWQKILGLKNIGVRDNFFDLGGDSLQAIRSIAAIKHTYAKRLKVRDFFDFPTIAGLSQLIDESEDNSRYRLTKQQAEFIPLSHNQEALYFLHSTGGSRQFHLPILFTIDGELNVSSLRAALKEIVIRHAPLHTVFKTCEEGLEQQLIDPGSWTLQEISSEQTEEEILNDWPFESMVERPFDLAGDYMVRAGLFHIQPQKYLFGIVAHHIAWDGWSTLLFKKELSLLYDHFNLGVPISTEVSELGYSDFSIYQRDQFHGKLLDQSLKYWRAKLGGVVPSQLRTDFPRILDDPLTGGSHKFIIDKEITDKLKALGKKHGATLFMVLLAGFNALLKRHSSQEDICVGIPVAGRDIEGLDQLIGYFVNTLPVRTLVDGTSGFDVLLQAVKANTLEAFDHAHVPFSEIVKLSEDFRSVSRHPVFQVLFVMQNNESADLKFTGLKTRMVEIPGKTSSFELTLEIEERQGQLHAGFEYQTELFSHSTIETMAVHLVELLRSVVLQPTETIDNINLLSIAERNFILKGRGEFAPSIDVSKQTVLNLIDQMVKRHPDREAVCFNETGLSYAELDNLSNKVANYLFIQGIGRGSFVPICLDNSPHMIIGILGIIKSGAAYIPIDPTFPKERIQFIIEDISASWIITDQENEAFFQAHFEKLSILTLTDKLEEINRESPEKPEILHDPDDIVYLIYTSGTTGKPKGVMITHRGLLLSTNSRNSYYPESASTLLIPSFSFDSSVAVIFGALTSGSKLILAKPSQLKDPKALKELLILTESILCVPSFYHFLLTENIIPSQQIKRVIVAGEKMDVSLLALHFEKNESAKLFNEYGPTEATVWATVTQLKTKKDFITIGKPIPHLRVYITDSNGKLCPVGIPGELCIAGESLAKGYLNRPDLTKSSFISDPFISEGKGMMYKTGDKARLLHDGNLEFMGRLDNQVKLRGYRIELEEIETLTNGLDFVSRAVVTLSGEASESQKLVGHILTNSDFNFLSDEQKVHKLIVHLSNNLPAYMVPSQWKFEARLPFTANGKIDRKKLSEMETALPVRRISSQVDDAVENKLKLIWTGLLKRDDISVEDDFFKIGGHSLLALRLINAIREHFNYEIKFAEIFQHPTIHQLASLIKGDSTDNFSTKSIQRSSGMKEFPVSFSQESLWLVDQLEGSRHYHIPLVLELTGALDVSALETTLMTIFNRHQVLRSVYQYNGDKVQQVVRDLGNWQLDVKDISTESWKMQQLRDDIQETINRPFDLETDLMFRARLIRQSQGIHILVMTFHHIAFDGWSVGILMKEIESFYQQQKNQDKIDTEPLPIQYGDYALWQRKHFQGNAFENKIDYWKTKLRGVQALNLTKSVSTATLKDVGGKTHSFIIPKETSEKLVTLASNTGTTLYMLMMSTFKTLLYQLTKNTDLCIGTVVADRQYQYTDKLIGYFINTLPIRSQLNPGSTFSEFLSEVKNNCLEAFDNQDVPFEKIVAAVKPERTVGTNPLFQAMFLLQDNYDDREWKIGDLKVKEFGSTSSNAKFDLTFFVSEIQSGLRGLMEFKTSAFTSSEIDSIIGNYLHLLEIICDNPSVTFDQLSNKKARDISSHSELISSGFDEEFIPVQELIEKAVLNFGDKEAIKARNKSFSYQQLNETSNQLADLLTQKGVERNDIVGVVMDRSIEMITAIIAVLKAGAAYLPVDTDFPPERIGYMLKDAAKVHITHKKHAGRFNTSSEEVLWEEFWQHRSHFSKENPSSDNDPKDPAYIIYTSGSTGKPKGVILSHGNLYNFLKTVSHRPGITSANKFLAVSSASFDIALLELILPFVHGAQVVVLDQIERKDPGVILDYLKQHKANIMFATPTHWKMLLESGWTSPVDDLQIISGGEALSQELAGKLLRLCDSLWNIYGPTETTVFSTIKKIEKNQPLVTIGREVLNTRIYILDEKQQHVPQGSVGEIYIAGKGVAKGYLNQPELTGQKFSIDPFQNDAEGYMYKTGDRAKLLPNGEIQILGRIDNQIKLRGHRIELEEIEQAIKMLAGVKDSVVLYRTTSRGDKGLVAYLLLNADTGTSPENDKLFKRERVKSWKKDLSTNLPGYMLPFDFVIVDRFPHTASGKVDRLKLPGPEALDQEAIYLPETPEEKKLAEIWKRTLGLSNIDINDNFFDLGGHSLVAVKVMTLIEKDLGTRLPLSILFKYPTIMQLAAFLEKKSTLNTEWDSLVSIQPKGKKAPMFLVHGAGLNVMPFQQLAGYFDLEQPIYGLQSKGLDGSNIEYESIEKIASSYLDEITKNHSSGEIVLGGYSLGGIIAYEMAKQLRASAISVKHLILFDTFATFSDSDYLPKDKLFTKLHLEYHKRSHELKLLVKHPGILKAIKVKSLNRKLHNTLISLGVKTKNAESPVIQRISKIKDMLVAACQAYNPGFYEGEITLIRAKIQTKYFFDQQYLGWKGRSESMRIIDIEGIHTELFTAPNDRKLAAIIKEIID
ncbi:amino acid adenylation domain-containing protein [Cyclobacterium lianum]|uniref:Amino acid adenylation domain-containing protein n=1 Tax=Cyclobacterium lianum TaxID=388280 RepID=A0A1M7HW04_9BACT|nr:non-ribosomal peptide synthetase [Cyclobacterium lianum]SHM32598.1 amino acid adenylation domain-containing protein [Cyclobacterium lianum]